MGGWGQPHGPTLGDLEAIDALLTAAGVPASSGGRVLSVRDRVELLGRDVSGLSAIVVELYSFVVHHLAPDAPMPLAGYLSSERAVDAAKRLGDLTPAFFGVTQPRRGPTVAFVDGPRIGALVELGTQRIIVQDEGTATVARAEGATDVIVDPDHPGFTEWPAGRSPALRIVDAGGGG